LLTGEESDEGKQGGDREDQVSRHEGSLPSWGPLLSLRCVAILVPVRECRQLLMRALKALAVDCFERLGSK